MAQAGDEIVLRAAAALGHAAQADPVAAEVLVDARPLQRDARFPPSNQSLVHEQERSGSAWTLEWLILPQMVGATAAALRLAPSSPAMSGGWGGCEVMPHASTSKATGKSRRMSAKARRGRGSVTPPVRRLHMGLNWQPSARRGRRFATVPDGWTGGRRPSGRRQPWDDCERKAIPAATHESGA